MCGIAQLGAGSGPERGLFAKMRNETNSWVSDCAAMFCGSIRAATRDGADPKWVGFFELAAGEGTEAEDGAGGSLGCGRRGLGQAGSGVAGPRSLRATVCSLPGIGG